MLYFTFWDFTVTNKLHVFLFFCSEWKDEQLIMFLLIFVNTCI